MIYTVFVEHTSSIRSFAKIATTNKQKAQKVFDEMCQYFLDLAQREGNASIRHWNNDSCIFRDVASCFLRTGLDNEASETSEVNIFSVSERILNLFHEFFDSSENRRFVNTGRF